MSYNGSGTFQINSSGQPVITGTTISSTVFNALTADLATGLSTAMTKDGQTTTTARIPFALGINSTLVTDATSITTGSIITAGGVGISKALYVGTTANVAGATTLSGAVTVGGVATFSAQPIFSSLTASSAVATNASKGLVSVTNTGTGNNVLATSPTIATPSLTSPTISDGTANGVAYLNGSKVLTTGSALVFDGATLSNSTSATPLSLNRTGAGSALIELKQSGTVGGYLGTSGSNDFIIFNGSAATLATFNNTGLGIGTSSPSTKLTVYDATSPQVTFNNGTSTFIVGNSAGGNNHILYGTGAYPLIFYTNATEAVRITSGGAVSFGSTGTNTGTSGQLLSSQGSGTNPTWVAQSSIAAGSALIRSATAQASTSGTSIDFTSIPSDAKRITIMFSGVSTNGSSNVQIQIGDSGGVETSGYVGSASTITSGAVGQSALSAGFQDRLTGSAATVRYATVVLTLLDTATTWTCTGMWSNSNSAGETSFVCGSKVLSPGPLDRVRITTVNGTDTFDAGSINILYE